MAELNAAWEVLRNPASRAAYDRTLVSGSTPTDADGAPPPVHPGAAVLVPDLGPRRSTSGGLPVGCVWALASVVVLGLVAVVALVLGDHEPSEVAVSTRESLGVGACVVTDGGTALAVVVEVPCGAPHDAVVAERTTFPKACSSGLVAVLLDDARTVICLQEGATPSGTVAPPPVEGS